MIKLVSNSAAYRILNDPPTGQHPLILKKVTDPFHHMDLLKLKLLEEVGEYLLDESPSELDDIIRVCKALKGEDGSFSEKWCLVSHTELEDDY